MGGTTSFPRVLLPKDQIVIVTGGNQGVGYDTAKWMAMMGATVIIACRSEERALKAIQQMKLEYGELKKEGKEKLADYEQLNVEFMKLDLASLKSTQDFINEFKSSGRKLHTLICNAGLGVIGENFTEDGNEIVFQVNYLSHFLILAQLLPVMFESGEDCRVVLISSYGHNFASFDDQRIQETKGATTGDRFMVYQKSKLYQIMQMYSLNRLLINTNVTVNSVHPGTVDTGMLQTLYTPHSRGCPARWVRFVLFFTAFKNTFEGAWTSLNAAVNPNLKGTRDVYFQDSKPTTPSSISRNKAKQDILWTYTLDRLKDYLTEVDLKILKNQNEKQNEV